MFPSNIRNYILNTSLIWLPKRELNNDDANRYAKVTGESPHSFNPTERIIGYWETQMWERYSSPGRNISIGSLVPNGQYWKNTDNIIQRSSFHLGNGCNSNEQRPWIWRRVGRTIWESLEEGEKRKKYCNYIIISKNNKK